MVKIKALSRFREALRTHQFARKLGRQLESSESPVFHLLINEFHSVSVLVATTASIVSAHRAGQPVQFHGSISAYLPADPLIYPAVAAGLYHRLLDPELSFNLQEFYIRTKFASKVTSSCVFDAQNDRGGSPTDVRALSDLWSSVCGLAIVIQSHLDVLDLNNEVLEWRLGELRKTLRLAGNGGYPLVANDGTIIVPGWIDRRGAPRVPLNLPVSVEIQGSRQRAILQDASVNGLGISSCQGVAPGMPIVIEFMSGRRLSGITVRVGGDGRIGLRLSQPLSTTDPLLNPAVPRPLVA